LEPLGSDRRASDSVSEDVTATLEMALDAAGLDKARVFLAWKMSTRFRFIWLQRGSHGLR
jgi:hypothetical protein